MELAFEFEGDSAATTRHEKAVGRLPDKFAGDGRQVFIAVVG